MTTPMDEALKRYRAFDVALTRFAEKAQGRRDLSDWIDLEFIERGDKQSKSVQVINTALDNMRFRLLESAFLDICSAFEAFVRGRVSTAVGTARKIIAQHYTDGIMVNLREKLIIQQDVLSSLNAIFHILDGMVSIETSARLKSIKEKRNEIAHGKIANGILPEEIDKVRDLLNEMSEYF